MADSVRPAGKEGATAVTAVTAVSKAEGVKADSTCGNAFKTNVEVGESNPHGGFCVQAGQGVFPLLTACFWSFPSMPIVSPGSRRTASNACHRVKSVSISARSNGSRWVVPKAAV